MAKYVHWRCIFTLEHLCNRQLHLTFFFCFLLPKNWSTEHCYRARVRWARATHAALHIAEGIEHSCTRESGQYTQYTVYMNSLYSLKPCLFPCSDHCLAVCLCDVCSRPCFRFALSASLVPTKSLLSRSRAMPIKISPRAREERSLVAPQVMSKRLSLLCLCANHNELHIIFLLSKPQSVTLVSIVPLPPQSKSTITFTRFFFMNQSYTIVYRVRAQHGQSYVHWKIYRAMRL